jgi:hypothetical protein
LFEFGQLCSNIPNIHTTDLVYINLWN